MWREIGTPRSAGPALGRGMDSGRSPVSREPGITKVGSAGTFAQGVEPGR